MNLLDKQYFKKKLRVGGYARVNSDRPVLNRFNPCPHPQFKIFKLYDLHSSRDEFNGAGPACKCKMQHNILWLKINQKKMDIQQTPFAILEITINNFYKTYLISFIRLVNTLTIATEIFLSYSAIVSLSPATSASDSERQ